MIFSIGDLSTFWKMDKYPENLYYIRFWLLSRFLDGRYEVGVPRICEFGVYSWSAHGMNMVMSEENIDRPARRGPVSVRTGDSQRRNDTRRHIHRLHSVMDHVAASFRYSG